MPVADAGGLMSELRQALAESMLEIERSSYRMGCDPPGDYVPWKARARILLSLAGRGTGYCRYCRRPIRWIRTRSGANVPFNDDCTPHWTTCPGARAEKDAER